jgi:hypothetical protein
MTEEEYKQLENLLDKLQLEVDGKFCLIPGHINDGYYIGVYSRITGLPYSQANAATIQEAVESVKKKLADDKTLK